MLAARKSNVLQTNNLTPHSLAFNEDELTPLLLATYTFISLPVYLNL
jgi:hypothetical protein